MKLKKLARQLSYSQEHEPTEAIVPLDPEEGYVYGDHTRRGPNPIPDEGSKRGKGIFSQLPRGSYRKVDKKAHMKRTTDDDYGVVIKTASSKKLLYPIRTPEEHVEAQIFFASKHASMDPKYRHEFATKLAAKADKNNSIPTVADFRKYAGTEFSNNLVYQIQARKDFLLDKTASITYDVLLEKHAKLGPAKFAEILTELDIENGLDARWDAGLDDPYTATYKTAGDYTEDYSWDSGDGTLYGLEIKKLAEEPSLLAGYLAPEIIGAFSKDPIDIFSSLPRPQKMLVMRAAKGDLVKREGKKVASDANVPLANPPQKDAPEDMTKNPDALTKGDAEVVRFPNPTGSSKSEAYNPKRTRQEVCDPRTKKMDIDEAMHGKVSHFLARKLAFKDAYRSGLTDPESSTMEHAGRGFKRMAPIGAMAGAGFGMLTKGRGTKAYRVIKHLVRGMSAGGLTGGAVHGLANLAGKDNRTSNALLNEMHRSPQRKGESDIAYFKRIAPAVEKAQSKPGEIPALWKKRAALAKLALADKKEDMECKKCESRGLHKCECKPSGKDKTDDRKEKTSPEDYKNVTKQEEDAPEKTAYMIQRFLARRRSS